jgi:hypothetical protein
MSPLTTCRGDSVWHQSKVFQTATQEKREYQTSQDNYQQPRKDENRSELEPIVVERYMPSTPTQTMQHELASNLQSPLILLLTRHPWTFPNLAVINIPFSPFLSPFRSRLPPSLILVLGNECLKKPLNLSQSLTLPPCHSSSSACARGYLLLHQSSSEVSTPFYTTVF